MKKLILFVKKVKSVKTKLNNERVVTIMNRHEHNKYLCDVYMPIILYQTYDKSSNSNNLQI